MWLPVYASRCSRALAFVALILSTPVALAHHGVDLADELPLWQIIPAGVVVALGFVGANVLRKWFARRRIHHRAANENQLAR